MNLVIEGPRGTGKTSYIEHMVKCMPEMKIFKDMSYYIYYNSPPSSNINTASYFMGKDVGIGQMLANTDKLILDRFFLSSAVYEIFRSSNREEILDSYKYLIPKLNLKNTVFHLMIHNEESIEKFLSIDRKKIDGYVDTEETLKKESELYFYFYENLKHLFRIELVEPFILENI